MEKKLTFFLLIFVSLGIIFDAGGAFFAPANAASYSGPLSIVGWVILFFVFLYMASCFAELASMFPKAGGIYEYAKQSYGRFGSFLIGWIAWLVSNVAIALDIVGANSYLIPSNDSLSILLKIGLSVVAVLALNYLAFRGIEQGGYAVFGFTVLLFITFLFVIIPTALHFNPNNYAPMLIQADWKASLLALFTSIFFAAQVYFGMEGVTYLSEEVEEPQKNIPKALMISMVIIGFIIILHVFFSLGYMNWSPFSAYEAPYVLFITSFYGAWAAKAFQLMVYVLMIGAAMGVIMATPYLLMAMSRDQLFLPQFQQRHKKYNTPYKAVFFQTGAIIFFALIGIFGKGFSSLSSMLVPLSAVLYSTVLAAVVILRYRKPEAYREHKVPFGKSLPILVVIFLFFIIGMWLYTEPDASSIFRLLVSTVLLGFPIYFLLEMYYNPKAITGVNDLFSYVMYWAEDIILPEKIRHKFLGIIGDIRGQEVLEFGCSVGTMTVELAQYTQHGHVWATDIAKNHLKITDRRLQLLGFTNVQVIHDESHSHRVHPSIPAVDTVVSTGILGYVQNVDRVLRELNHRLKVGGRICLLEYDKFFGFIPNIDWLGDDEKIIKRFGDNGFSVNVIRKKGLLWHYVFIYGHKSQDIYKFHYVSI